MSWLNLNDSLNSIKGQLSSFASGVLTDNEEAVSQELQELKARVDNLQKLCADKDAEIQRLQLLNAHHLQQKENGEVFYEKKEDDSWSWGPSETAGNKENGPTEEITQLKQIIETLENDKKDLMKSLEQLDTDHQETINKLIALKDGLQVDYNNLKDDYEDLKREYGNLMNENLEKTKKIESFTERNLETENQALKHKLKELVKIEEDYKILKSILKEQDSLNEECVNLKKENELLLEKLSSYTKQVKVQECEKTPENGLQKDQDFEEQLLQEKKKIHEKYTNIISENLKEYLENEDLINEDFENEFCKKIDSIQKTFKTYQTQIGDLEERIHKITEENIQIVNTKNFEIQKLLQNSEVLSREVLNKTEALKEYKNECAQLMENNDMLISELQTYKNNSSLQTISESNEDNLLLLENQLENANKRIQELEFVISDLEATKQEHIIEEESELVCLKEKLDLTLQELNQSKEKYEELLLSSQKIEKEKNKWHNEYLQLKEIHSVCDKEIQKLRSALEKLNNENENLEYSLNEKNISSESLMEENETYKNKVKEYEADLKECVEKIKDYEEKNNALHAHSKNIEEVNFTLNSSLMTVQSKIDTLQEEIQKKTEDDEANKNQIRCLTEKLQNSKMSETGLKLQVDTLHKELQNNKEIKQSLEDKIINLEKQVQELNDSLINIKHEKELLQENLQKFEDLKKQEDGSTYESVESDSKLQEELQAKISILENENAELNKSKNELITFVKLKHEENVKYHNEIQRLNQILTNEYEKQKMMEQEINNLKQQINNEEIFDLKEKLTYLKNEKISFGEEIKKLTKDLQIKDEQLLQKNEEIKVLAEKIKTLYEKCEVLGENLRQEQANMQKVLSEYTSPSEREQSLLKELERLRAHLVETEESYTQELLSAEQRNQEMLAKVNEIEQREKQSSSVYTSINIRANQQVETLQTQLQLLTNQRDELRRKISDAEDQINKQNAALTNLQLVLQQFQKDKEKDVYIETERIRRQIKLEKQVQDELRQEIDNLKSQLEASKQGLQAASRLSDQLESSKLQLSNYKDKVRELQDRLQESEAKFKELSTNSDAKVDKTLIKNLFIGFISSNQNSSYTKDQNQILKIIASVLDFNQQETEKVKLNKMQQEGWLNSVLYPHAQNKGLTDSKESLSEAFIKFLEMESKPKVIPNLLPATSMNKLSGESSSSNSSKRQSPVLLSEIVLPTFADFGQSRSSSSILKDVLKDNS